MTRLPTNEVGDLLLQLFELLLKLGQLARSASRSSLSINSSPSSACFCAALRLRLLVLLGLLRCLLLIR